MKRVLIIIVLIAATCSAVHAQNWPFIRNANTFTTLSTLVTATSTTGITGDIVPLGMPFPTITCLVTLASGSDPTDVVTTLKGSLDGTNMVTLATTTSATLPATYTTRSATAIPVQYIQGTYVSRATGTDSAVKMECMGTTQ